jgi:hypothetical protein
MSGIQFGNVDWKQLNDLIDDILKEHEKKYPGMPKETDVRGMIFYLIGYFNLPINKVYEALENMY